MVTVDKENLQADTSNTAEESTTEEKQATAPSVAEEPDEQGAATTDNADSDAPQQAKSPDQEKTGDGAKRKIVESEPPSSLALRPVKRARTAYFIFADDRRAALQANHPGEGVAVVARELGKIWATIPVEEKEAYQQQAAQERARVAQELEAWKAAGGVAELPSFKSDGGLIMPVARIRKICKLDPEVRNLSKEALLLVTKAAELMTAKIAAETVRVAQIQNRRKLLPDDVAQVCSSREQFLFLREDIQDLAREAKVAAAANSNTKGSKPKGAALVDGEPAVNPLTAYFAVKPK